MQLLEAFPPPWAALWPAVCSLLMFWVKVLLFPNWKLFIMSCFLLLSTSSTRGLRILLTIRVLPGLFQSVAKVHLQSVALSIFRFCFSHGIALEAQWIPRSLNERADLLSRLVDKDDWWFNPSVFRLVDAKWGPQLLRFDSNNWSCPLVGLVVDHSSFHSLFRSHDLDYSWMAVCLFLTSFTWWTLTV